MKALRGGPFPLPHQRGALTQGHVGKPPHASFLDDSVPLKGELFHASQLKGPCCSLALLALSSSCRRPPVQVAVVLALFHYPPGDSWVPGKERRASAGFCSEETGVPQAPNLDISNSAVFYGLGFHWEWIFPCSFQAGIPRSVTIIGPPSLSQRSP